MTEPSFQSAGQTRGRGPAGLLTWPRRIPLNRPPEPARAPAPDTGFAEQAGPPARTAAPARAAGRPGITVPDSDPAPLAKPAADTGRPLGRPGAPAIAGAAIAGALLVVVPLALSALSRPETVATVPITAAGAGLRADGPGSGGARQDGGDSAADAAGAGAGGGAGQAQEDPGFVPEAMPEDASGPNAPGGDAPGAAAENGPGGAPVASAPPEDEGEGGDGGAAAGDGGGADAGATTGGGGGGDGGGGGADGPGTAPMAAGASPGGESSPGGEDDGPADGGAESGAAAAAGDRSPSPSASEPATSFTAIAGPGCPAGSAAAYGAEGAGTDGWATRSGGYADEGCDGSYDAIPVSGTTEHGDGRFAYWTFRPGRADADCDLFVFVPDDESPQWVAEQEAMYQIFPGAQPSGTAAAVFGVEQASARGGWVRVTGFTSPAEQFTVQLTNIGENSLADQGATTHVAASAVRATCT
ncbi:hypothetical protein [Streptomonospora nanhaiensis]|uniref:Uncharacterized protein n=1 Tax=Streptomonospora nanhaiensis TaxID=1323731 RepID=A0A853BVR9_9ACTN|nr:hypothetical protein [Streptomonospora nanhaiensis]MBV2363576.1 hypothetical protein [Streptomonospora nanhaiensis]NYI98591.1 hypothetical protein [Streptomonospora nanhaiensis]